MARINHSACPACRLMSLPAPTSVVPCSNRLGYAMLSFQVRRQLGCGRLGHNAGGAGLTTCVQPLLHSPPMHEHAPRQLMSPTHPACRWRASSATCCPPRSTSWGGPPAGRGTACGAPPRPTSLQRPCTLAWHRYGWACAWGGPAACMQLMVPWVLPGRGAWNATRGRSGSHAADNLCQCRC